MLYRGFLLHFGLILRCEIAAAAAAAAVANNGAKLMGLAPRVVIPAPIVVAASQDWYDLLSSSTEECRIKS